MLRCTRIVAAKLAASGDVVATFAPLLAAGAADAEPTTTPASSEG